MSFICVIGLNMILSSLVGFMHGGILGYFVGIMNIVGILIVVLTIGFMIGSGKTKKDIENWITEDNRIIKETEKEFSNESKHI